MMPVECARCKAGNPAGKRFCGDCGAPLDPALAAASQFMETSLHDRVKAILTENYKDQKLVEVETTQAIASRFSEWAKLLGFFVGIPVAVLLLVLAALGIKTYSDFVSQVGKVQQDVTVQLNTAQASATKLKADGDALAADYGRLRERFSDTSAIATRLESLSQKVDLIGEKVGFTASSKISTTAKSQIADVFHKYQRYLQELGYKGTGRQIEIDIRESKNMMTGALAYYDSDKRQVVINASYANSARVLHEYMHQVLYFAELPQASSGALLAYYAIESGLAQYFPSSFLGTPTPEVSTWDLTKKRSFGDIRPDIGSARTTGAEVWGSAFWEMRQTIGQKDADKALFDAWFELKPRDMLNDRGGTFVKLLLKTGGAHAPQIQEIFMQRGLAI